MKRIFDFGLIDYEERGKAQNRVTVEMEYKEDREIKIENLLMNKEEKNKERFSVCANVWNAYNTDIICGGQCLDSIAGYIDSPLYSEILRLWKLYHLNDMHPECEHQHAAGWHKIANKKVTLYHWRLTREAMSEQKAVERAALTALRYGKIFKPTTKQAFFAALSYSLTTFTKTPPENIAKYYEPKKPLYAGDSGHTETKALGWLHQNEHPDGILSKPCPVCGYKYGTSWIHFPIPAEDKAIIYRILRTGKLEEETA